TGSGGSQRQLTWYNRKGDITGHVGDPDSSGGIGPALSRDERHLAMYRTVDGNSDIWLIMDLERGGRDRLTAANAGDINPLWWPDNRHIVYSSNRGGATYDLYLASVSGPKTDPVLLLSSPDPKSPLSVSFNGRYLLYRSASKTGYDIWALEVDKDI